MSTPFHLQVPRRLYEEMLSHAGEAKPNECCGLLAGTIRADGRVADVCTAYRLVNELASPTEFLSEPRSMFEAVRDIDRRSFDILAVYHSHPTSPPVPSGKDRERNYSPEVVNLIISLQGARSEVRAWWLEAETYREASWEVVDE